MPDRGVDLPEDHRAVFTRAAAEIECRLTELGVMPQALSREALAAYPARRDVVAGWRIEVKFSDRIRSIDLLLPTGFPWQPPRVALVDRPPFLTWPHIEEDGVLCLVRGVASSDPDDAGSVAMAMLGTASDLVEKLLAGEIEEDFRDEVLSYWGQAKSASAPEVISLVMPSPPSRIVSVWRGKSFYLLGENEDQVRKWLTARHGHKDGGYGIEQAVFIWLEQALLPDAYPSTGNDLRKIAAAAGMDAQEVIAAIARQHPPRIVYAIGMGTSNGPAIVGGAVEAPHAQKHGARDPLNKGFRPGHVPDAILAARSFGGNAVIRSSVARADAGWIHGRDQDLRAERLKRLKLVVLGCGSVGAPVALSLAQAGLGHVDLVDNDLLTWANIGRHPLGASSVGQSKSKALAHKIQTDYPHHCVTHHYMDVDTLIRTRPEVLDAADLIVSATGDWAAETRLDFWSAGNGRRTPIVYGWTEAHACAGHAVLVGGGQGCLRCGFDNTGLPHFRVTEWAQPSERREPACGAVYQPYGPVELGFVTSLVASLALDSALGFARMPTHRVWIAPARRLTDAGGAWTDSWRDESGFREEGGLIIERAWPSASCARCREALAA